MSDQKLAERWSCPTWRLQHTTGQTLPRPIVHTHDQAQADTLPHLVSAPFPGIAPHSSDKFPSPLFFNWCQSLASATCAAIYLLVVGVSDGSLKRDGVLSTLGLKRLFASLPGKKNDGATTPPTTNGDGNGNGNGSGSTPQVAALRAYINGTGSATVSATASENGSLDDKTEKDEESRRPSPSPEANSKATVAAPQPPRPWYQSLPVLLLQVSIFQTTAGPLGFLALRHISYPTMVLGKVGNRTSLPYPC